MTEEAHEITDNEGMTLSPSLERTEPIWPPANKPKRKAPERFGPVTSLDLERLREMDEYEQIAEIDRLVIRSKIAEAQLKNEKKRAKAGK